MSIIHNALKKAQQNLTKINKEKSAAKTNQDNEDSLQKEIDSSHIRKSVSHDSLTENEGVNEFAAAMAELSLSKKSRKSKTFPNIIIISFLLVIIIGLILFLNYLT